MPMLSLLRYRAAAWAAGIHSLFSVLMVAVAAGIVLGVWYVCPYSQQYGEYALFYC